MVTKLTADELIRNASEQHKIPEKVIRDFAKREQIDPVAFWREKQKLTEWKERRGQRARLGGEVSFVLEVSEGRSER